MTGYIVGNSAGQTKGCLDYLVASLEAPEQDSFLREYQARRSEFELEDDDD